MIEKSVMIVHPEYDGVKYYGSNDMAIGMALGEAEQILKNLDGIDVLDDINKVIELYNVQQLIESGVRLRSWSNEEYQQYQEQAKKLTSIIARYFSCINDDNFINLS